MCPLVNWLLVGLHVHRAATSRPVPGNQPMGGCRSSGMPQVATQGLGPFPGSVALAVAVAAHGESPAARQPGHPKLTLTFVVVSCAVSGTVTSTSMPLSHGEVGHRSTRGLRRSILSVAGRFGGARGTPSAHLDEVRPHATTSWHRSAFLCSARPNSTWTRSHTLLSISLLSPRQVGVQEAGMVSAEKTKQGYGRHKRCRCEAATLCHLPVRRGRVHNPSPIRVPEVMLTGMEGRKQTKHQPNEQRSWTNTSKRANHRQKSRCGIQRARVRGEGF